MAMKCKVCSTKVPRGIWEGVCPECGWRSPSNQELRAVTILITVVALLCLPSFVLGGESLLGIPAIFWTLIFCACLVIAWVNYVVVKRRRNELRYDG